MAVSTTTHATRLLTIAAAIIHSTSSFPIQRRQYFQSPIRKSTTNIWNAKDNGYNMHQNSQIRQRKTQQKPVINTRRKWLSETIKSATSTAVTLLILPTAVRSIDGDDEPNNIPAPPEERSGLVVLRVAEVAQFQEKLLRAVVRGDIPDVVISPQQIVFGTKILLKNSNIAGNMKLMIEKEVPRERRRDATRNAADIMNTLQDIYKTADAIQRPFKEEEMLQIADSYRFVRLKLNAMYEYLPSEGREKYYGYFMAVTDYEKKIAEGVYNPDIDGVLKLEYD